MPAYVNYRYHSIKPTPSEPPVPALDITACPKLNNVNVQSCPNLKELTFSPEVNQNILYLAKDAALVVR